MVLLWIFIFGFDEIVDLLYGSCWHVCVHVQYVYMCVFVHVQYVCLYCTLVYLIELKKPNRLFLVEVKGHLRSTLIDIDTTMLCAFWWQLGKEKLIGTAVKSILNILYNCWSQNVGFIGQNQVPIVISTLQTKKNDIICCRRKGTSCS